ncbi:hypothetical protein Dfri01_60650 [Dyadobacter frigoris]|nr:hypothetical protein Dfri01_60650 [Dyadobacter frigoris]
MNGRLVKIEIHWVWIYKWIAILSEKKEDLLKIHYPSKAPYSVISPITIEKVPTT